MENKERIQELQEVSKMAAQEGRFDVVETCFLELQELQETPKIVLMINDYVLSTPIAQIISNRITQLIEFYGKNQVIFSSPQERSDELNRHMKNLELTYGKYTCIEVKQWFKG